MAKSSSFSRAKDPSNPRKKSSFRPGGKSSFLNRKANAEAGYAKRRDKKKQQGDVQDVYEYLPEKTRRSKVQLDLSRSEAQEFGGNLDEFDDSQREALRARLIGENDDDEKVDSEDDEELDSDAAFEESDEERFAGFFGNKKKKKSSDKKQRTVRFTDVDLNEDDNEDNAKSPAPQNDSEESEEEEEEGEDDEFIDLLDVLDGKGEIDMGSDDEKTKKSATPSKPRSTGDSDFGMDEDLPEADVDEEMDNKEGSGSSEEDEDDDEEGEDEGEEDNQIQITASDDDEENDLNEDALSNLQTFVSNLETTVPTSQKRKASADEDAAAAPAPKRRTTIREKTEAGVEDEFRIDSSGSKLNLDDLLAPLATQSSSLQTLKKSTKILGSSKTKALSAPLPQRAQERLDREAAYEKTKEEVDKWSGTMKKIREAEHLSFPLQAEKPSRVSNSELTAKFKPTTPMESAVSSLLASANLSTDISIHDTESSMLTSNNLTLEEVASRRAELRKMRELMFRAETKARRVKKIKSKAYRKLRRKEKERLAEQLGDNTDSDEEGGDEERQRKRAMERATLRHKHTGKWAKQMKSKHLDVDQRKELEEMLDKGEKLRRKIQGVGSDDEEDEEEEDSSEEDGDVEEGIERIKSNAFDELKKLKASNEDGEEGESGKKRSKSIFEMKFMKDAMARQQAAANREADDFIKELGAHSGDDDDESGQEEDLDHDPQSGVVVHRAGGRVVYRPGAAPTKPTISIPQSFLVPPPSDTSSVTLKSTDFLSPPPTSPVQPTSTNAKDAPTRTSAVEFSSTSASSSSNPWLTVQSDAGTGRIAKRKNEVVVSKESKSAEKSKNKLSKAQRKREEEKEKARDDAELDILTGDVLTLGDGEVTPKPNVKGKGKGKEKAQQTLAAGGAPAAEDDDEDSDGHNSELEFQEQALQAKGKGKGKGKAAPGAFQQRDLVALAFAGDNVVKEFEEAKKREIAEDAPKEVDTTIPGWGSWGGTGLRAKPPKPSRIKKIAGIDPTTRADYNKKHIIISEKKDKKASKYLVQDLPYPYTSQAQFEKAMDRPLGVQWNTRSAFQRATLPRVVKKPGVVITPLEKKV